MKRFPASEYILVYIYIKKSNCTERGKVRKKSCSQPPCQSSPFPREGPRDVGGDLCWPSSGHLLTPGQLQTWGRGDRTVSAARQGFPSCALSLGLSHRYSKAAEQTRLCPGPPSRRQSPGPARGGPGGLRSSAPCCLGALGPEFA